MKSIIIEAAMVAVHATGFRAKQVQPPQFWFAKLLPVTFQEFIKPAFPAHNRLFKYRDGIRHLVGADFRVTKCQGEQFTITFYCPQVSHYTRHFIVHFCFTLMGAKACFQAL